ncbi:MAG TPA: 4Fe-4S binding protein [Actinomycetota bacterium]|nr:4Fe-4S binding protein [Actinomycetota bacterium]
MAIDEGMRTEQDPRLTKARRPGFGLGLLKGLGVTIRHMLSHNKVIQYPDVKQDLPPRTRGVIALKEENCTVCMLCARECPDWCIYIDSHKETLPPKREGGRARKRNVLDRFAIDYALCMYCGICVEVCPYDALFWSREFEYSEYDIRQLTHEKERLSDWMASVLPPPPLEVGAEVPGSPTAAPAATVEATAARPATTTSSAAEARPAQAAAAPTTGTAATEAARPAESVPRPTEEKKAPTAAPAEMAPETLATGEPAGGGTASDATATAPATSPEASAVKAKPAPKAKAAPKGKKGKADSTPAADASAIEADPAEAPKPTAEEVAQYQETPGPNVEVPHEEPKPIALVPTEDPEAVYREVLEEQLAKGSSPQVAEARAKVARVKAERGIKRGPSGGGS